MRITEREAIEWLNNLIETMKSETSGNYPDPEYKDEVYEALDMAINALKAIDEIKAEIENLPTGVELTDGSIREFAFKNYKKGLLKMIDEKVKENKK